MKDIDAIVERFMEAEDANFSLFNYVNEVHGEVEKLEEQIADIKVCLIHLGGSVSKCGVVGGGGVSERFQMGSLGGCGVLGRGMGSQVGA